MSTPPRGDPGLYARRSQNINLLGCSQSHCVRRDILASLKLSVLRTLLPSFSVGTTRAAPQRLL